MKHLITGGCGFLGSNLISHLIRRGNQIICLDNLSSGSFSNIKNWINNDRFIFLKKNVIEFIDLEVDYIWHLASPASPLNYMEDPVQTSKICFNGTLNMLELAKKYNAKMLFTSSSEVYGDPKITPQNENYNGNVNIKSRRSCYAEGKRIAESLCYDYQRKFNIDIKVARIFNCYGPGMLPSDKRVISSFIMNAINNKELKIFGNGEITRTFCYVEDLINGLLKLMESNLTCPVNLGSKKEITITNLARLIIKLTNKESEIIYLNEITDDPKCRKPEIEIAKKELNWSPKIELVDGINRTISYFKELSIV